MTSRKRTGDSTDPCKTPRSIVNVDDKQPLTLTIHFGWNYQSPCFAIDACLIQTFEKNWILHRVKSSLKVTETHVHSISTFAEF